MIKFFIVFLIGLKSQGASATSCPDSINSARKALICVIQNHPELKVLDLRNTEFKARESMARELPNPELDAKTNLTGEKKVEIDLVQTFELGGKRSARIENARIENEIIKADDEMSRVQILSESIAAFSRFRQLREQQQILNETSLAIGKIISSLKRNPVLPPDQKTSLRLFTLYTDTIDFKKLEIEKDIRELTNVIEVGIARPLMTTDKLALSPPSSWPRFEIANLNNSVEMRLVRAQQGSLEAESLIARSSAWPDFKIGPSFEHESESALTSWGVKAGLTLPLWNQNSGARNLAKAKLDASKLTAEARKKKIQIEFDSLRVDYQKLAQKLEKSSNSAAIEDSIKDSARAFSRGLIPPTSLIEVYRSSMELIEQTHQAETNAWQMWVRLQYLTNPSSVELP